MICGITMPVAAAPQKDGHPQLIHYHHILPKPSAYHGVTTGISASARTQNSETLYGADPATLLPEMAQVSNRPPQTVMDHSGQFFSTHSPPILNLSPNLSPAEPQRTSPFYDLRDSTRRRSFQDVQSSYNHQVHHSPQLFSGYLTEDPTGRKSESPSRKRRKTSNSIIDLTNSPSPPPQWAWDITESARLVRRRSVSQRRGSGERCASPRARRSPGVRRRAARERHLPPHQAEAERSPDRRAFQPPLMAGRQIHPAALPHLSQQAPVAIGVDQVPVSTPVTMGPYGIPVCTGPHHIPVCTTAHMQPMCTSQPTWSIPGCTMQIPGTCSMQHIPACGLTQLPITHTLPPMIHHSHPSHHLPHHQHHITAVSQFPHHPPPQREEEMQILSEHRPTYAIPAGLHPGPPLNPSPPVILQEPSVHPTPQDLYGPFHRFYTRHQYGRNGRLRSFPPPPPPYPGFLLHFLAMLGNPPVPPFGRDLHDEATEVENYEALLNLAERLGEAKPRGLTKPEIEQLPAYRFNSETHRSDSDQTSCVVCMCDFENRQLLRVLPCSHEFHAKCVDRWLKTNRTCPICRADASEIGNQSD